MPEMELRERRQYDNVDNHNLLSDFLGLFSPTGDFLRLLLLLCLYFFFL